VKFGYYNEILDLPDTTSFVYPNPTKKIDIDISECLQNPIKIEPFSDFIANTKNLVVIVNDATRPTPTSNVLDGMYNFIKDLSPTFVIATGSHRSTTFKEKMQIFGKYYTFINSNWKIVDHNCRDEVVHVGTSKFGTDIHLNELVMNADKLITINSVEPHYFAGFTGGRKSIVPGVGGYITIEQNHKFALNPMAKVLALEGNPVHKDLEDIVDKVNKDIFSVQLVVDKEHDIYSVSTGNIKDSFYDAVASAKNVFVVQVEEKADIVVSIAKEPGNVNLYQSQKAIDNAKFVLKDNGILILLAKCEHGIGDNTFYRLLKDASTPTDVLNSTREKYKLGYHKSVKIAEILEHAEIWCVSELQPTILDDIFIKPFKDAQSAVNQALADKGKDSKILVLTDGCLTVPVVRE
jgi:nickel-dependent lactate racemase